MVWQCAWISQHTRYSCKTHSKAVSVLAYSSGTEGLLQLTHCCCGVGIYIVGTTMISTMSVAVSWHL